MAGERLEVLTIGHSTLSYQDFARVLVEQGVTAVADVRSAPYSRYSPHFNRNELSASLKVDGISYVFLGKELGGRPSDPEYYRHGRADYERMAAAEAFARGIDRVMDGARKFRIALMCSEKHPLECHRCLLVGRALAERGIGIHHITDGGATETQKEIESQLLGKYAGDLFLSPEEALAEAYRKQALKVAFAEEDENNITDKSSILE